jgi:spore maturation protein CgeB
MKILYLYQLDSTKIDIPFALSELGHEVHFIDAMLTDSFQNELIQEKIIQEVQSNPCECVITFNFYPYVSKACELLHLPYVAWLFDSPVMYTYTPSILNSCNYIFCFDKKLCNELIKIGIQKVFYMPLAANTSRLDSLSMTEDEFSKYNHDISFVGRLFQDNNFNKFYNQINSSFMEYFNQLFQLQYMTPNQNIFYSMLSEKAINLFQKLIPNNLLEDYPLCEIKKCYSDIMLSRKFTELQRTNILDLISKYNTIHIYTDSDISMLTNVVNMGGIESISEAPKLFYASKINLNFTQISIQSGLPLRVFDIIGTGGFLISNAQSEFNDLFTPGEDVILYHNPEELIELINYYLTHDKERKEIAHNGYVRIKSEHTYTNRLEQILQIVTAHSL